MKKRTIGVLLLAALLLGGWCLAEDGELVLTVDEAVYDGNVVRLGQVEGGDESLGIMRYFELLGGWAKISSPADAPHKSLPVVPLDEHGVFVLDVMSGRNADGDRVITAVQFFLVRLDDLPATNDFSYEQAQAIALAECFVEPTYKLYDEALEKLPDATEAFAHLWE